jgi:hypothetical protein
MWLFRRSNDRHESDAALEDAKRNLLQVQRRGSEVDRVSDALIEIRRRNHFAEHLEAIVKKNRGSLT